MKTSSVNVLWLYVDGIQNVMEFAIRHNTKKVFYVSTVETFGRWIEIEISKKKMCGHFRI